MTDRDRVPTPSPAVLGALGDAVEGELVVPGDASYDEARVAWNARFDEVRPRAVARCRSAADVAAAIAFAAGERLPIAVRSGGHDFGGRSSTDGLVIDVGAIDAIEPARDAVRIGAGALLGDVYRALDPLGLTLPGGTCPQVGIGGLALGGGLGVLGRRHGLLADRMIAAEVVLADGTIVACDEHRHDDLFWALRGAGAIGLGVVTAIVFAPVPAPERAVDLHASWPPREATRMIAAWQEWGPAAPETTAASLKLTVPPAPGSPHLDLYATHLGATEEAERELDELIAIARVEPESTSIEPSSYPRSREFWATLGAPAEDGPATVANPRERVFAKSEFFRHPLDGATIEALVATALAEPTAEQARELDFMPWGGAYGRRGPEETAFVHREESFLLKPSTSIPLDAPASAAAAALERVERMWAATRDAGSGRSFQNFADPALDRWAPAYHGENLPRLRRVKDRYDPDATFGS